jgi:hypothetical protein
MLTDLPSRIQLVEGHVDLELGCVQRGDGPIRLTTMERRLLQWLAAHPRDEVSHHQLLREVWDYAPGVSSRAPYFTVRRLRTKIEHDPESPRLIQTVHGVGFRFMPLDAPSEPTTPIGNLPLLQPGFLGRDALLDRLGGQLLGRSRLHLYGPIGVGKTTLALALAHRSGRTGWYLSLPQAQDLPMVLARLAAMCGHESEDSAGFQTPGEAGKVVQMLTAAGAAVLVLDELAPQLTRPLLDALGPFDGQLQFVSVHAARVSGPDAHPVPPLEPEQGALLLRMGAARVGRRIGPAEDATLQEISRRVDGLPLALELLLPRLRLRTPKQVVARPFLDGGQLFDGLVEESLTMLRPAELEVLRMVSAHPGSVTASCLGKLLKLDELTVLDHLDVLTDHSLLRVIDPPPPLHHPRFSAFAPVRSFLRQAPEHLGLKARVRAQTLQRTQRLVHLIRSGDHVAAVTLRLEEANLEDAAESDLLHLRSTLVLDHCLASHTAVEVRRSRTADVVEMAEAMDEPALLAEALLTHFEAGRGTAYACLEEAERALAMSTEGRQSAHIRLAMAHHHLVIGSVDAAGLALSLTRAAAEALGDSLLLHAVLQADLYAGFLHGDVEATRPVAEALLAHRCTSRLEHLPNENLVNWYDLIGDLDAMTHALRSDLRTYAYSTHRAREGQAWANLGYVQMIRHDPAARDSYTRAIQLARLVGNRHGECAARVNHASLLLQLQELEQGRIEGLAALHLAQQLQSDHWQGWARLTLAHLAAATDPRVSVDHLNALFETATTDPPAIFVSLGRLLLPTMLFELGEHTAAEVALNVARQVGASLPDQERFRIAIQVHEAFDALVRGDPSLAEEALRVGPETDGLRILRAWCVRRL